MEDKKTNLIIIATAVLVTVVAGVLLVLGGGQDKQKVASGDVVSQASLHWHAQVAITVNGKREKVPANIGISSVHNPIHTHDQSGQVHMEFESGPVKRQQLLLGEFFKAWKQPFSPTQLAGKHGGRVTMLVNGKPNSQFESYQMKDKDEIELRYSD